MPYYKDQKNEIYFLDSEEFENLLPSDCLKITDEEADELRKPTVEQVAAAIRAERDGKIAESNWLVERHHEQLSAGIATSITDEAYHALLAYRQDLRDVPEQSTFPQSIIWPEFPV